MELSSILLELFARGGGGGSGGGGGGGGIIAVPIIIILAIVAWWRRRQKIKKANQLQAVAESVDSSWSDEVIEKRVSDVFYAFQKDWSNFNFESMKHYLTPEYFNHIHLMLVALKQMGRTNRMEDVKLNGTALFDIRDSVDDELDEFDIEIKASATDSLVESATNEIIFTDKRPFVEIWHFEREGQQWALEGISQPGAPSMKIFGKQIELAKTELTPSESQESSKFIGEKVVTFAKENSFYYNADFGWLLMPRGGLLFSDSDFKNSDINHHVLGLHKEILIQFFEYVPYQRAKRSLMAQLKSWYYDNSTTPHFIIGAATLPRDYGNIIVLRKKLFGRFTPKGLHKVETESLGFNKKYQIFASDMDRVNSLELLHPVFIEKLEAFPFVINIEIIGSTLYVYSTDTKRANFQEMLIVLQEAFIEMKM